MTTPDRRNVDPLVTADWLRVRCGQIVVVAIDTCADPKVAISDDTPRELRIGETQINWYAQDFPVDLGGTRIRFLCPRT